MRTNNAAPVMPNRDRWMPWKPLFMRVSDLGSESDQIDKAELRTNSGAKFRPIVRG